jgi:hypothetical protein
MHRPLVMDPLSMVGTLEAAKLKLSSTA